MLNTEVRAGVETKLDEQEIADVEILVGNWERTAPMFAAMRARTGMTLTQVMLLYVLASMPDGDGPEPWQTA